MGRQSPKVPSYLYLSFALVSVRAGSAVRVEPCMDARTAGLPLSATLTFDVVVTQRLWLRGVLESAETSTHTESPLGPLQQRQHVFLVRHQPTAVLGSMAGLKRIPTVWHRAPTIGNPTHESLAGLILQASCFVFCSDTESNSAPWVAGLNSWRRMASAGEHERRRVPPQTIPSSEPEYAAMDQKTDAVSLDRSDSACDPSTSEHPRDQVVTSSEIAPTAGNVDQQSFDSYPPLQLAEEQDLEVDELDGDSALGSDSESVTASLTESIYNYRREYGRTYHDRLDLQHHILQLTYGNNLHFAPLINPKHAIDVGTGTGIWAIDFADEYPECHVVGIDLSPGQPTL
nr:secondary metabolism regulator laea [Quercus suber]